MENSKEFIVNVQTSRDVAELIEGIELDGLQVESVEYTEEHSARFGIAEVVTIIGIVQGVMAVVKLALEIRNLIKKKQDQKVQLSAPGAVSYVVIDSSMSDEQVEKAVRAHFGGR